MTPTRRVYWPPPARAGVTEMIKIEDKWEVEPHTDNPGLVEFVVHSGKVRDGRRGTWTDAEKKAIREAVREMIGSGKLPPRGLRFHSLDFNLHGDERAGSFAVKFQ